MQVEQWFWAKNFGSYSSFFMSINLSHGVQPIHEDWRDTVAMDMYGKQILDDKGTPKQLLCDEV
jgi:hypothetical protein